MKSTTFILLKTRDRKRWVTELYNQRNVTPSIMKTLRFDATTGQLTVFIRLASEDFEYLIHLIGPKIIYVTMKMVIM